MPEPNPDIAIGIDLGTSTSIVSVFRDGKAESIPDPITKSPIVPSAVAKNRRGELVVGEAALASGVPPETIIREAKRAMGTDQLFATGDQTLRAEEVAALVLRKMTQIAENHLGQPIERAVVTVPAYFGDIERRATMQAAQLAGLDVIRLISEPTAAAMAYGQSRQDAEETLLVFDLGGGTLDVTILEMIAGVLDVKMSHGDKLLGGKDMDQAVIDWAAGDFSRRKPGAMVSAKGREGLKRAAEAAKKEVSEMNSAEIFVSNYATLNGAEIDLDINLTRSEFDALIQPLVDRALRVIDETLRKASIRSENIDRILLVGGGTYVPAIRKAVESHLNRPVIWGVVNPDIAVSQGAALSAALATGSASSETSVVVQDSSTMGVGIIVVEDVGNTEMLVYSELMGPGTAVPFMAKRQYLLRRPDQTEMEIEVVQDPTGRAKLPEDTIPTAAKGVVTDIPPALYGNPHKVEIIFECDQNHNVQLSANILGTGKSCTIRLDTQRGMMDLNTFAAASARIDSLWETSPLATRHSSLIRRAEKVLAEEHPRNEEVIEAVLVELKAKIAGNDSEGAMAAREKLTDLLAQL